MEPEKLYAVVGKLYLEAIGLQSAVEQLQKELAVKVATIKELESKVVTA